jgi:hypothetical protein
MALSFVADKKMNDATGLMNVADNTGAGLGIPL